jgi:hypothetical protein
MADVLAPAVPQLVTVRNVPLFKAGEDWPLSTGPVTFTLDHLVAAVNAPDDPEIRNPVVKLGHNGPLTSDQPTLGKILNMYVDLGTLTAHGDFVGMPYWLAASIPYLYPSRSIEGRLDFTTSQGQKFHSMVLTGVSLLGEEWPGITNIQDLEAAVTSVDIPDFVLPYMPAAAVAANAERRAA